jgi:hypothetical protein
VLQERGSNPTRMSDTMMWLPPRQDFRLPSDCPHPATPDCPDDLRTGYDCLVEVRTSKKNCATLLLRAKHTCSLLNRSNANPKHCHR